MLLITNKKCGYIRSQSFEYKKNIQDRVRIKSKIIDAPTLKKDLSKPNPKKTVNDKIEDTSTAAERINCMDSIICRLLSELQ
jgi:hypothetical protein